MSEILLSSLTQDGILTLTLNRPEVHNAFNEDMIAALTTQFQQAGNNPDVKLIILKANGESFSAGADLNWMKRAASFTEEENIEDAAKLHDMLETIDTCPKPVIGVIHGACYGGGVGLTSVCDITIGCEKTLFCLSEVKLGLIPAVIAPFVMKTIGAKTFRHLSLSPEAISGEQALTAGFITHFTTDLKETTAFLTKLCLKGSLQAQAHIKSLIRALETENTPKAITTKAIAKARASKDGQEGIAAFLNKNK